MFKDTNQHILPLKINVIFALSLILPLTVSLFNPTWRFAQFTPRQLIYTKNSLPLLTAFWASPTHTLGRLSRILQAGIVACIPQALAVHIWTFWVVIGLARTLSGFMLSRVVGWSYPQLFSHWALYETSSGTGPAVTVYLIIYGWPWTVFFLQKHRSDTIESLVITAACLIFCWFDNAPWTYAMASMTSVIIRLVQVIYVSFLRHRSRNPITLEARRFRAVMQTAISISLLLLIPMHVIPSKKTLHMPTSPDGTRPFLEILILSYPRPGDTASPDSLLSQTISSYLSYADTNTVLSVFTHATTHMSFTHAQEYFAQTPILFYIDTDAHEDSYPSQHLHVAEAFRWVSEKPSQAVWIMLVEDDFPLCGEWGWGGILAVMNKLQHDGRYGGFVGTGGSGLIIHHTLLPILIHTLQIHALQHSPLLPSVHRPADLIIQDCLFGADVMCPRNTPLVITSRLVMDHIGGTASTDRNRWYGTGRWRCGWRHAFHGFTEVDVVPV